MTSTRSADYVLLATCMVILGLWTAVGGVGALPDWAASSAATRIYVAVSLVGGAVAVLFGVVQLTRRRSLPRLRPFAIATFGLLAVNQFTGLIFGTILCHGPG